MKEKKIGILSVVVVMAAVVVGMILLSPKPVLQVDTTKVYSQEAMVYIAMAAKQFEETGGDEIWELSFAGQSAQTTVEDAALETLLQIKLLLNEHATNLSAQEQNRIAAMLPNFKAYLGEEWVETQKIEDNILLSILQENYLVSQYKETVPYEEAEIEEQVEKDYSEYQEAEEKGLLNRVRFDWIIYYNGILNENEWVRYPTSTQQQQFHQLEIVQQLLRGGESFDSLLASYGDHREAEERMLFYCGFWEESEASDSYCRGQLNSAIAGKIFKVEAGTISDLIETSYGYMLVRVAEYQEATEEESAAFRLQLAEAMEESRADYIEASRQESLRNEVVQLKRTKDIQLSEERWAEVLQSYWDQKGME